MNKKKNTNNVVLTSKIIEFLRTFLSVFVFLYYAFDDFFDVPLVLYSLFTALFTYIFLGILISFIDFFILKLPKKILKEEKYSLKKTSLTSHDLSEFIKIRFFCRVSSICLSFIVSIFCNDLFLDMSFIFVYFISRSITDFFLKRYNIPMLNYKIIKIEPLDDIKSTESSYKNSFTVHGHFTSNFLDPRNPASPNYVFKNH